MKRVLKYIALVVGLLAVSALSLLAVVILFGPSSSPEAEVVTEPVTVEAPSVEAGEVALDETGATYAEAKQELRTAYDEKKETLPQDVVDPLDKDLGIIEGAVADLLAALASDPDNDSLKRMLVMTYRNEMSLLKKALHLSGDDEEEDLEPVPAG